MISYDYDIFNSSIFKLWNLLSLTRISFFFSFFKLPSILQIDTLYEIYKTLYSSWWIIFQRDLEWFPCFENMFLRMNKRRNVLRIC